MDSKKIFSLQRDFKQQKLLLKFVLKINIYIINVIHLTV